MDRLIVCGDIHGELRTLVYNLTDRFDIHDASVIVAGDFGVGFSSKKYEETEYKHIEKDLEKYNLKIYVVRGNHDCPQWFDGKHDFPRIKFLLDYKIVEIAGRKVYPVGGGISIDQEERTEGKDWWPDEDVKRITEFPVKVDLIISHMAPISFSPVTMRDENMSAEIYEKCINSRSYLEKILDEVKCKYWFYGHYHKSYSGHIGEMMYRGLGIHELYELWDDEE